MSKMSDIEGGFFIMKIGLPRGLLYHSYGPFMEAFLSELPAEIIISEETDRDILDRGTAACIDDACLPVKVYAGHVESLRENAIVLSYPGLCPANTENRCVRNSTGCRSSSAVRI